MQLCTYFYWYEKIAFTGLLKMRQSCTYCAKTRKLQKGKKRKKGNVRLASVCFLVCVCVRQSAHLKSGKVFPFFCCTDFVIVCLLQSHLALFLSERKGTPSRLDKQLRFCTKQKEKKYSHVEKQILISTIYNLMEKIL